jgi:hypothetical protein
MRLEGLRKLKKSNDLTGNRNGDLPACSIVPQPATLPRAPIMAGSLLKFRPNVVAVIKLTTESGA